LKRLNHRKEDYLSSLSRFKEKTIRSNFLVDMTDSMMAITSN